VRKEWSPGAESGARVGHLIQDILEIFQENVGFTPSTVSTLFLERKKNILAKELEEEKEEWEW
jgi:hypothetical protein